MLKSSEIRFATLMLLSVLSLSCSNTNNNDNHHLECEQFELPDNAIYIHFNNGGEPTINNQYENNFPIISNGEHVIAQNFSSGTEYNLVVSGKTTNGSLKIYGNRRMGLYLNNVSITNPSNPAINIQNRQRTYINLVSETSNYIADGMYYTEPLKGEDAKGTLFSEGEIHISGCGYLETVGRHAHAIVVDNDIEIANGRVTVASAARDGIHANGEINVRGGIINITSVGDAIQSEYSPVRIYDGEIYAKTTGIKSHGIKVNDNLEVFGGMVDVNAIGKDSKGFSVKGDLTINGGNVNVKANDDGIKVHGNFYVGGSTNVCAWSLNKDYIDCNGVSTIVNDRLNGSKCTNVYF